MIIKPISLRKVALLLSFVMASAYAEVAVQAPSHWDAIRTYTSIAADKIPQGCIAGIRAFATHQKTITALLLLGGYLAYSYKAPVEKRLRKLYKRNTVKKTVGACTRWMLKQCGVSAALIGDDSEYR